jgi:hypothetical protein
VLLFEKDNGLWSAGHMRTELEGSLTSPELNRVHEVWMVDARASALDDGPTFRRVLPVPWLEGDTHRDSAS